MKCESSDMLKANFSNCFNFVCIRYFIVAADIRIKKKCFLLTGRIVT
jgi:hypothetical protein